MGNLLQDYILNLCLKIPFSAYIVPMELTICRRLRHHKKSSGTSPVVQWLRIHLSRDVHWIPGWGTKIPHTCRATKPTETREPGCSRARDPQQEKPSCMLQLSATTKTQHNPKEGKVVTWTCLLWLKEMNSIIDSTDVSLSKLWEIVKDRETWCAEVPGVTKSWTWLSDWTATATHTWSLWPEEKICKNQSLPQSLFAVFRRNWLVIVQKRLVSDIFVLLLPAVGEADEQTALLLKLPEAVPQQKSVWAMTNSF